MSISTTFTLRFSGAAVSNGIARITGQINRLGGVAANLGKSLVSPFAGLAAVLAPAALGVGFVSMVKDASAAAASVEDLTMQFETLTKSSEMTKYLLSEMKKDAANSPLGIQDYAQAGKTLIAFGFAAEDVMPTLKNLADVSMGNADRFGSLALAFAQTTAAGRLMGQEVLQFVNAGFNPLQQISKKTGETMLQLKKRMEDGKVSASEVAGAFRDATSAGGLFYKAIEKGGATTSGKIAKVKDAIFGLKVAFGTPFNDSLKEVLDKIGKQITLLEWKAEKFGKAVGTTMTQLISAFEQGRLGEVVQSALLAGLSRFGEELVALMVYSGNMLYDTISERISISKIGKLFDAPGALGNTPTYDALPEYAKYTPGGWLVRAVDAGISVGEHFDQQGGSTKTLAQTRQGFRDAFGSVDYAAQLKSNLQAKVYSAPSTTISTQKIDTEQHRLMREMTEQLKGVNEKLSPQP